MQPGSSVATALSEGESKRKHVVLLEVQGMNWRTIKFPLETVRPFVFGSVALAGQPNLDPEEPSVSFGCLQMRVLCCCRLHYPAEASSARSTTCCDAITTPVFYLLALIFL